MGSRFKKSHDAQALFQELIISLVLTKERIKALEIKIASEMVMMVTKFKNLFFKMSSIARLKNSIIILFFQER